MHRLFVAIRPPPDIRAQLVGLMEGVRGVRWQQDDQLHLTLRFIGEVERPVAEDIASALETIRHPPFAIALNGIGCFERHGKGTLWVGVTPRHELEALHKKIDRTCVQLGLEPDMRAFRPHITIARLTRSAGPIDALALQSGGASSRPFDVDSFHLYESDLTPSGPLYSVIARYALR